MRREGVGRKERDLADSRKGSREVPESPVLGAGLRKQGEQTAPLSLGVLRCSFSTPGCVQWGVSFRVKSGKRRHTVDLCFSSVKWSSALLGEKASVSGHSVDPRVVQTGHSVWTGVQDTRSVLAFPATGNRGHCPAA